LEQQDSLSKDIIVFEVVESTEVGTDDQDCTRQITELTEFAERAGYTVTGIYQEKASGARNDRPERAKVIDLAKKRKIDAVLVHELSRWTRSTVDNITTLQALASWNVSLITMNGVDFDLTTPMEKR